MRMKKRGLSGVVVVMLMLVISIILVMILWSAFKQFTKKDYDTTRITIHAQILNVSFVSNNGVDIDVNIKRDVGKGNLTGLKFIFKNFDGQYYETRNTSLEELEEETFSFDLTGKISNIKEISIAPIILSSEGNEYFGAVLDTYKITDVGAGNNIGNGNYSGNNTGNNQSNENNETCNNTLLRCVGLLSMCSNHDGNPAQCLNYYECAGGACWQCSVEDMACVSQGGECTVCP